MSRHPPALRQPAARHRNAFPFLAILGLIACLAPPLEAEVIDDFNGPPKWNVLEDPTGFLDYEFVDGQLRMSHPHLDDPQARAMWYWRTYVVPEDRWLELRVDHVTASQYRVGTGVVLWACGPSGLAGYALWRLPSEVFLAKVWLDESGKLKGAAFIWDNLQRVEEPVTVVLGLKREAASMNLLAKLVMRDNPSEVIYENTLTDHPGPDEVLAAPDFMYGPDLVPPPLGPSLFVLTAMLDAGFSDASLREQVIDNFVCSEDPVPVALGIRREGDTQVALNWQGAYVPFAAASPQGPWEPCPELITDGEFGSSMAIPLSGSSRFFRLVRG